MCSLVYIHPNCSLDYINTKENFMSISLTQRIHSETDQCFFAKRLYRSLKTIAQEKGCLTAALTAGGLAGAKVYALAISYFCMEGTVRSFMAIPEDDRPIVRLRPLGDVGGWTDLALFSMIGFGALMFKIIQEGEYLRIKSLCQKWIQDNKNQIEENPAFLNHLHAEINDLLDAYSSQCLFSKSLLSRRLVTLEILPSSHQIDAHAKLSKDRRLQNIFCDVQSDLEDISLKHYFHRVYEGHKSIKNGGGRSTQLSALIMGVAIPLILLSSAIFSLVGEFGLGKELFIDREELTDTGHFGEWPFNATDSLLAAFLLHLWYMLNEGDFVITKKIYARHMERLQNDSSLHNRLCSIANADLSQRAGGCSHFKLPMDYRFKKT